MFGLVLLSVRFWSENIAQFYVFYVLLGLMGIGLGPIAFGDVVSRWFDKRRGLALGLAMLGIGCGAVIIPPVAQHLITSFGWRNAYAIFGFAVLLFPVPVVAAFLKDQPQDLGILPDGAVRADHTVPKGRSTPGLNASEAWHTRTFWFMTCAFFLTGASLQGCVVHLATMLSDRGMNLRAAAMGSSLLGLAVMMGRVGTGYILDRLFAPRVAALSFGCAGAGILLFLTSGASPIAFLAAFLIGLGLGAEIDIIPYLISRYFGLHSFAQIYSLAFSVFVLAGAAGSFFMGAGYDLTGSYQIPLAALLASILAAALLMTQLGPYRFHYCPVIAVDPFVWTGFSVFKWERLFS